MKNLIDQLSLITIEPNDKSWPSIIEYVHERYEKAFAANLNSYMPHFMALMDKDHSVKSLCGYREAKSGPLFLENYLDSPVEALLTQSFETEIRRDSIIEFGQLASFSRGISAYHFLLMTEALVELGYEWCIFTATDVLHALITHMGLETHLIAYADASRVSNATKIWGHYYEHNPRIVAGNIKYGAKALRDHYNSLINAPHVIDTIHNVAI